MYEVTNEIMNTICVKATVLLVFKRGITVIA